MHYNHVNFVVKYFRTYIAYESIHNIFFLIFSNIILHYCLFIEPRSQDWNVTRMVYKPRDSATRTPSVAAPTIRPQSQPGISSHDLLHQFSRSVSPLRHQPTVQDAGWSQAPQRRSDFVPGQNAFHERPAVNHQGDSNELIKALNRADVMERRAKEAEQILSDTLQQLTLRDDQIATLKKMVEDAQEKTTLLQQKLQVQQQNVNSNGSQDNETGVSDSAMQRVIEAEECATLVRIQLTQAEEKIDTLQAKLTKANEMILHLQQNLTTAEQRTTEAEQRVTQANQQATQAEERASQAEQRATSAEHRAEELTRTLSQIERRAIEAEASSNQAERSAQLSQHQAFNSEMRAREAERQRAEAEEQVRLANGRAERAERRAAFVDRGDERMWALERDEIILTDTELGRGGWAVVKIAEFRGIRVAAKCIYNNILSDHNRALFVREMNMAARLRHPNLVQFIGATTHGDPFIVMELLPTTLRIELQHGPPSRNQILVIAKDVASALNYMHLMHPDPLIHRDVSSANVLLEPSSDNSWKGKLSDYGSVNFVQRALSAGPGNPSYAAPEANDPASHSPKMDVYSYGVLLSEMCSGRFPDSNHSVLVERVADRQMADLVGRCLTNQRDRRPTMSDILETLSAM